jgi:hypothetical protein
MPAKCECCGQSVKAKKAPAKRKTITFGGRNWPGQSKEYETNMRVKRGELVWSPFVHMTRFGARGDFVTPENAAEYELAASA